MKLRIVQKGDYYFIQRKWFFMFKYFVCAEDGMYIVNEWFLDKTGLLSEMLTRVSFKSVEEAKKMKDSYLNHYSKGKVID